MIGDKNRKSCIFFMGGGHGGIAAFRSLRRRFSMVEVFSDDANLLSLARPSDRIAASMNEIEADLGVMSGFLPILGARFLVSKTLLNIHYSLLPKYRGLHSVVWSILNNEKQLG